MWLTGMLLDKIASVQYIIERLYFSSLTHAQQNALRQLLAAITQVERAFNE